MSRESNKGYRLEADTRDYLAGRGLHVYRPQHAGANRDAADIHGVYIDGAPVLIECKNHATLELGRWITALTGKVRALAAHSGAVVHKRRGKGDPAEQYVTMTLRDYADLLLAATEGDED